MEGCEKEEERTTCFLMPLIFSLDLNRAHRGCELPVL